MTVAGTCWPSRNAYSEALQDPASAFTDGELAAGTVETDALGLPRVRSGQMASVYKLRTGSTTWAVRCFALRSAERDARYAAIADFLARTPNPYTVEFGYAERGVVVDSQAYPIVKMRWVEGELLDAYIARNLADAGALERLAFCWIEMVRHLHRIGFAHGDLQHGNVLVTPGGKLKLVDYDGAFVPGLAGRPSIETGHPNYQHPCRQLRDFGPELDNFSAWTVYLSIVAVVRDAEVWQTLLYGDDCLALRREDYIRPSASPAFRRLKAIADPNVSKLAGFVESLLSHPPQQLPALERFVGGVAAGRDEAGEAHGLRFTPFDHRPLGAGSLTEPYEPPREQLPEPAPPRGSVWGRLRAGSPLGAGVVVLLVASVVGYAVFRLLGFDTNEYLAVVALAWVLAAILVVASHSPKPPSGSRP